MSDFSARLHLYVSTETGGKTTQLLSKVCWPASTGTAPWTHPSPAADPQTTSRHIPTSPNLGRGAIELLLLALGLIQCHRKKSSAWAVQGHGISTILPAPHPSSGSPDEGAPVTFLTFLPWHLCGSRWTGYSIRSHRDLLGNGTGWLFPAGCLGSRRDPGAFRRSFTRITACFSPGVFEWLLPAPGGSLWAPPPSWLAPPPVEAVAGLTLMHWRTQVSVMLWHPDFRSWGLSLWTSNW